MTRAPLGRYLLQSARGPGWAARAGGQHAGGPYRPGDAGGGAAAPALALRGRNAGRHESSKVRAVVTTTRRSPLIRWPPQLAASQIRAAARIATKNTTTMTAAGIARSLRSCLCTSVPLAVDGAGRGAAGKPGAAALAASAAPGSACSCRTYACPIRRCAPSPLAAARAAPVGADPRRGTRPGAFTGIARMPGPDVALGSVSGRRWQPPPRPAIARPGRHLAPGPAPGVRGDGQAWS
jgi:hypothetical protein